MDVAGVIATLALAILWAEASAWLPRCTRRVVRAAAKRLTPELQNRMEEEWLRHVEDVPGTLGPFIAGCQFLWASIRIRPIQMNLQLRASLFSLFKPRAVFLHDGKALRRFVIGAKVQAAAVTATAVLLIWTIFATITELNAMGNMEAQIARMERDVAAMRQRVQARRAAGPSQHRPTVVDSR